MSLPLITIGITCYNAEDTIGRAIASARRQTWSNNEIVLVDDASTDTSRALIDELVRGEPSIRVIQHPVNRGLAGALNNIVKEARGEFISFFDDDDESSPKRLEAQWSRIVNYEKANGCGLVLCYSNRNVIKRGGDRPHHIARAIGRHEPEPHGPIVADYLLGLGRDPQFAWGLFGSCTLMARRETFLRVGPFDETFRRCAEWDFAIRAAFLGTHFVAIDKPLVTTYKTPGAEKAGNVPLKFALQLRTKYKDYLRQRHVYWSSRAIAFHNFHGSKGRKWRSRAYLGLACLASPFFIYDRLSSGMCSGLLPRRSFPKLSAPNPILVSD